jgi:hypothetical protein
MQSLSYAFLAAATQYSVLQTVSFLASVAVIGRWVHILTTSRHFIYDILKTNALYSSLFDGWYPVYIWWLMFSFIFNLTPGSYLIYKTIIATNGTKNDPNDDGPWKRSESLFKRDLKLTTFHLFLPMLAFIL